MTDEETTEGMKLYPKSMVRGLEDRVEELEGEQQQLEAEFKELQEKHSKQWKELALLRREAEQGFNYYPGPSSHCGMCEVDLKNDITKVAHGLCGVCKTAFDSLHPGARVNPQAMPEKHLTPV